jgi:hypothetical protein
MTRTHTLNRDRPDIEDFETFDLWWKAHVVWMHKALSHPTVHPRQPGSYEEYPVIWPSNRGTREALRKLLDG